MNNLAIIIPAYKPEYLQQTLDSFVRQTNKNFTIYIGDDNSPYNIYDIVKKYLDKLQIVYKKFDENFGGVSLVKQWERCIELSKEEWIWLFSDDDVVSETCVETFYNREDTNSKFFKFNTKVIDNNGNHIMKKYDKSSILLSKKIESIDFIKKRLNIENFRSFAVEYIFHRDLFNANRFVDFPLAWVSDDATWFKYSIENQGYISILNDMVYWRHSGKNISSSVKDNIVNEKKIQASIQYLLWLNQYSAEKNISLEDESKLKWLSIQIASLKYEFSYKKYNEIIKKIGLKVSYLDILKNYLVIQYYHLRNKFN